MEWISRWVQGLWPSPRSSSPQLSTSYSCSQQGDRLAWPEYLVVLCRLSLELVLAMLLWLHRFIWFSEAPLTRLRSWPSFLTVLDSTRGCREFVCQSCFRWSAQWISSCCPHRLRQHLFNWLIFNSKSILESKRQLWWRKRPALATSSLFSTNYLEVQYRRQNYPCHLGCHTSRSSLLPSHRSWLCKPL